MRTARIILASVLAVALMASSPSAQSANQLFQQALSKEQAEGKLEDAIVLYERVVKTAGSDRSLTARALLQIGRCYEKLGQQGARKSYERLLQEFPDQKDVAVQARARLTALLRSAAGSTAMRTRQLTEGNDPTAKWWRDFQGLSPDGSKALFADYTTGQNLVVYDLRLRKARFLTDLDWSTYWVCCGVWSPRGDAVAYQRYQFDPDAPGEVHVTSLDGQSRMIFRNDEYPGKSAVALGWYPDAGKLLVLQGRRGSAAFGTVPATGGPFTMIRDSSWEGGGNDRVSLSPDGRFIAFTQRENGGPGDIWVMSSDGAREFQVTNHPANDFQPLWSPDGRYLAFVSDRFGSAALWVVPVNGSEAAGAPFKIKDGMQDVALLAWDTRGIAYRQDARTWDIFVATKNESGRWSAARQLRYGRTGRNVAAAWSPDGTQLAFVASVPAEWSRRYLVVYPADAGPAREFLIPTTHYNIQQTPWDLRWFGNGRGLGFSGEDASGRRVVFRLTLATGEWQVVPLDMKTWTRIEWNDDGTRFYYVLLGVDGTVFEHDIERRSDRNVYTPPPTENSGTIKCLKLSADRRRLAFSQWYADRSADIVELNVTTGERRKLVTVPFSGSDQLTLQQGLAWTEGDAGLALLFTRFTRPGFEMRIAPLDGGAITPLKDVPQPSMPGPRSGVVGFDLSADGRRIAYIVIDAPLDAFIIENPLADAPPASRAGRK